MDNDTIVRTGNDVTVVVSRTVFPGFEEEYDEWVKRLVKAASEAKGNTGVTTLIPQRGKTGLYHVLFRFKDQESVEEWEGSEIRKNLTQKADEFSQSHRQAATGLETWFSVPDCPQLGTPPHWKMAAVTSIAVFLVSTIIIRIMQLLDLGLNFYVENLLVSILVVASLTWAVMPLLSRVVFRKWLYK
jgi:antibiotic biosynthesis monooxygenase (ABM) superfamily enzyme